MMIKYYYYYYTTILTKLYYNNTQTRVSWHAGFHLPDGRRAFESSENKRTSKDKDSLSKCHFLIPC